MLLDPNKLNTYTQKKTQRETDNIPFLKNI